ncbi:MAG: hypothetical protein HGN29_18490 [Asgard group archaeon]|nr:hypothetical protein [Asgard group archaeon]
MNRKKIIILVSILVLVIGIPVLISQTHRIVKKRSLIKGYYTIESVICTDKFGNSITLMVKSLHSVQYELFPEVINPLENIIYYDNATYYSCFGYRGSKDSVSTFTFTLDIKVQQNNESQKLTYIAVAIFGADNWSESFWFDKLGGELFITFRLLLVQR